VSGATWVIVGLLALVVVLLVAVAYLSELVDQYRRELHKAKGQAIAARRSAGFWEGEARSLREDVERLRRRLGSAAQVSD